jgi:hypothetical protein
MMNSLTNRSALVTALATGVIGVGALIAACSSSGGANGGTNTGDGGGGGGGGNSSADGGATVNNGSPGSCATSALGITFAPMYSAFISSTSTHSFQIPAVTADGNAASWSSSDPSSVNLAPDPTSGGIMITVTGAGSNGTVQIFAAEGTTCGASTLNITQNTEDDWTTGNNRYNNGVAIHFGPPARPDGGFNRDAAAEGGGGKGGGGGGFNPDGGSFLEEDGGTACTNCHGPTATNGLFNDVSHTPEQTGGFSDSDLISIITQGIVPDGGYFDPTVLRSTCVDSGTTIGTLSPCGQTAYEQWQAIHKWVDITTDEQAGIVCYLRSLQPEPQNGTSNFGGKPPGDGGTHHHDGGGKPPTSDDSGATGPADSATGSDDATTTPPADAAGE